MNKLDLITTLAEKEGLKDKDAFDIVNTMFDGFTKDVAILQSGEGIERKGERSIEKGRLDIAGILNAVFITTEYP